MLLGSCYRCVIAFVRLSQRPYCFAISVYAECTQMFNTHTHTQWFGFVIKIWDILSIKFIRAFINACFSQWNQYYNMSTNTNTHIICQSIPTQQHIHFNLYRTIRLRQILFQLSNGFGSFENWAIACIFQHCILMNAPYWHRHRLLLSISMNISTYNTI